MQCIRRTSIRDGQAILKGEGRFKATGIDDKLLKTMFKRTPRQSTRDLTRRLNKFLHLNKLGKDKEQVKQNGCYLCFSLIVTIKISGHSSYIYGLMSVLG